MGWGAGLNNVLLSLIDLKLESLLGPSNLLPRCVSRQMAYLALSTAQYVSFALRLYQSQNGGKHMCLFLVAYPRGYTRLYLRILPRRLQAITNF